MILNAAADSKGVCGERVMPGNFGYFRDVWVVIDRVMVEKRTNLIRRPCLVIFISISCICIISYSVVVRDSNFLPLAILDFPLEFTTWLGNKKIRVPKQWILHVV